MSHTLVTFLGKSRESKDTGYRKTVYRFPDGTKDETAFFGLALSRYLSRYLKLDTIVILGTCSSQWGVLVEHLAEEGEDEDARLQLIDAEVAGAVEQPLLDRLAPLLMRAVGFNVSPRLISFGKDEDEQYGILRAVADAVPKNGAVSFDLTHGFRHLGMVGFLSAFMLERVRSLKVQDLWYGALDMARGGVTPVLKLDGLVGVRRWLDALDRFDATGDYGVFAPLLIADMKDDMEDKELKELKDKANCLRNAAFYERTCNVLDAARQIRTFRPVLDTLTRASGLFRPQLAERLRWATLSGLAEQQRELAHQYLNRGDFVRAAIFGREACVTHLCEVRGVSTVEDSQEREEAVKKLTKELKGEKKAAYRRLTRIRNSLAHATPPHSWDKQSKSALKDPDHLHRGLKTSLDRFFQ